MGAVALKHTASLISLNNEIITGRSSPALWRGRSSSLYGVTNEDVTTGIFNLYPTTHAP